MIFTATPDSEFIARHRAIWAKRPELRSVYQEWFCELLKEVRELAPVVEVGSGPGFFKDYAPHLISTDVLPTSWIDVSCDACSLPFRPNSVSALVMVDTLHHLPLPLDFIHEAIRVLRPGGRLAILEPWVTPLSYLLYRYLHHEGCHLGADLTRPFHGSPKKAFDGNAAIPFLVLKYLRTHSLPLRLVRADPFIGLPYLVTFGFQRSRPVPGALVGLARLIERFTGPFRKLGASRILAVWEKMPDG